MIKKLKLEFQYVLSLVYDQIMVFHFFLLPTAAEKEAPLSLL